MIKYDYTLEQVKDAEGHKDIFKPEYFDTTLPNLVYLKGPNSKGKSTILNILALGFYGLYLDGQELHEDLRERILNLVKSEHQKIKFSIKVENEKIGPPLLIEKPSLDKEEIIVYRIINDRRIPIIPEDFFKEYKLIYDIPQNPLKRIDGILNEIKIEQKNIGLKIKGFRQEVESLINDVRKTDNMLLLRDTQFSIDEENNRCAESQKELRDREGIIDDLKQFIVCKMYSIYLKAYNKNVGDLTLLRKKAKAYGNINKKIIYQGQTLKIRIQSLISNAKLLRQNQSQNIRNFIESKVINRFEAWLDLDIPNAIIDPTKLEILIPETEYFIKLLSDKKEEVLKFSKDKLERNKFFRQLIEILDSYKTTSITIPGINKVPIDFIRILKHEIELNEDVDLKIEKLDSGINELNLFLKSINQANEINENLSQEKGKLAYITDSTAFDPNELDRLEKENQQLSKKFEAYKLELGKLGISEELLEKKLITLKYNDQIIKFDHYNENELNGRILSIKHKIEDLKTDIDKSRGLITKYEIKIQDYQTQKPHIYLKYLRKLEELNNILRSLEQKLLVNFENDLISITKTKSGQNLSNQQLKIAESISKYLANKIPIVKHNDTIYQVESVDFISKAFKTKNNTIIDYGYMGTGQAQSAYLSGLLNVSEDKKLIVLFDEVALMDEESLKLVTTKLKSLYDKGKVLLGIIVQVDKKFSNESLL